MFRFPCCLLWQLHSIILTCLNHQLLLLFLCSNCGLKTSSYHGSKGLKWGLSRILCPSCASVSVLASSKIAKEASQGPIVKVPEDSSNAPRHTPSQYRNSYQQHVILSLISQFHKWSNCLTTRIIWRRLETERLKSVAVG